MSSAHASAWRRSTAAVGVALALAALIAVVGVAGPAAASARPAGGTSRVAEEAYSATGTIKSFGPDRAFVNIAHDDIPGFMDAMTMSFRARSADQLAGLAAGDAVRFRFVVQGDGARVLASIEKR